MPATDRQAVENTIAALTEAWAAHDPESFADQFTVDATYVTWVGTRYQGRPDIAGSHRELWHKFLRGTQLADEITDIRFPTPDTAIVTSRGDVTKGRPKRLGKIQTYTLVREPDGRWRIAAFHNTKNRPLAEAISFRFAPGLRPSVRETERT